MHRLPDGNIPAYMEADTIEGDPDSDLTLTGAAQVRRIDGVIKGDRINYRKDTGEVDVQGNARMMRDGTLVTGPNAKFNVDKYSGEVEKPNFWLGATGGFAVADKADIFSKSQMRLHTVTYSGCSCETPSWYIKANTVDIDFDENEGVARNGVLYFKDVPILASPYMTFPVKKERKSGFLMPTYGTTSKGGFDFSLPYYLNIAPNYDATLQPRYFSKRGLQLGGNSVTWGRATRAASTAPICRMTTSAAKTAGCTGGVTSNCSATASTPTGTWPRSRTTITSAIFRSSV
ncbi:Outer membrane protein Imp, required for envelope biogenesis / Organic solvent tolerance protein precursor [Achromobacter xylosoxidans NH44784-1996]|nr:Outer membrane protein Imp, required for envelope biogenesis / Organic solvent tolerance protein precursor [Achromobacter xylosoxidans NH44784-1996]